MPDFKSLPLSVQEWAKKYGTEEQVMNPEPGLESPLIAPDDLVSTLITSARAKALEKMAGHTPVQSVEVAAKPMGPSSDNLSKIMTKEWGKSAQPIGTYSKFTEAMPIIQEQEKLGKAVWTEPLQELSREDLIKMLEQHSKGLLK